MIYINYNPIMGCTGWVVKKPFQITSVFNKTNNKTNKYNNYEKR